MARTVNTVKTLSAAEARSQFSEMLNEAAYKDNAIVIKRHKKKVAVLINFDKYSELIRELKRVK